MQCVRFLDECFTTFSLWLDCKISEHNLLDVPDGKPWKIFQVGVYGHIVFTSILVVVGISCFCTGIENSFMYTEVNCTDGVSLTAPLVNIVAAFVGLVAIKQPESSWAAFVHFVVSLTIFLMNIYFTCDQILMSRRWFAVRARTDDNWPIHFAWIDLSVVVTLLLVELSLLLTMSIYIVLKLDLLGWRRNAFASRSTSRVPSDAPSRHLATAPSISSSVDI